VAAGALAAIVGGAVIARADDPNAGVARVAGGLAVSPVSIDRAASVGSANVVTVGNRSTQPLEISVAARPWTQSASGLVSPNRRGTLAAMNVSDTSFTLAPGASKPVTVTLRDSPAGGSLYGAVEVIGLPSGIENQKGLSLGYRIVGSLRLRPRTPAYGLKAGAAKVSGSGSARTLTLSVRNTGNTIEPVTGSIRLRGPLGTHNSTLKSTRILPGKSVALALAPARSLPAATYTATVTLTQAKTKTTITKRIKVSR
jgi:hypothetical protein